MNRIKLPAMLVTGLLTCLVLISCGAGPLSASSKTGTITGRILDDNNKPLGNIHDDELLVVSLFCFEENPSIECLHEDFWDVELKVLINSICEENDKSESCLVHLGNNAAAVDQDGSYTIENVPPGSYGVVLIYKGAGIMGTRLEREVDPVTAGGTVKLNIETDLIRK
jgi:hypothetical protein